MCIKCLNVYANSTWPISLVFSKNRLDSSSGSQIFWQISIGEYHPTVLEIGWHSGDMLCWPSPARNLYGLNSAHCREFCEINCTSVDLFGTLYMLYILLWAQWTMVIINRIPVVYHDVVCLIHRTAISLGQARLLLLDEGSVNFSGSFWQPNPLNFDDLRDCRTQRREIWQYGSYIESVL